MVLVGYDGPPKNLFRRATVRAPTNSWHIHLICLKCAKSKLLTASCDVSGLVRLREVLLCLWLRLLAECRPSKKFGMAPVDPVSDH